MPLSLLSLYRDIEDYQWAGMDGPGEEPLDGAFSDGDMMFEDEVVCDIGLVALRTRSNFLVTYYVTSVHSKWNQESVAPR